MVEIKGDIMTKMTRWQRFIDRVRAAFSNGHDFHIYFGPPTLRNRANMLVRGFVYLTRKDV